MRWITFFLLALSGCSPQRFFYYPNRNLYVDPDRIGVRNELVRYPSANGKTLVALYFPAERQPKGTVVHFHGNYGNVSNHFPLALFLIKRGYNVLSFDYQGYGASEGSPSPAHMIADGLASVQYADRRNPGQPVLMFAQSIGASVGIVVAAQSALVRAAVLEAPFATYRSQGGDVIRRHWFLFPMYVLVPFLNHHADPMRYVAQIAPRPVLFIHGDQDKIVALKMSERLFAAAREPKQLWIVPGAGHLECHKVDRQAYENRVVSFFDAAIGRGG